MQVQAIRPCISTHLARASLRLPLRSPATRLGYRHAHQLNTQAHRFLCSQAPKQPGSAPPPPFSENPFKKALAYIRKNSGELKQLIKQYGKLTLTFYFGLYFLTLGAISATTMTGVVATPEWLNANKWLNSLPFVKSAVKEPIKLSPKLDAFLAAWLLTKTTEPFRIVITLATVPLLVKRLPPRVLRFFGIDRPQAAEAMAVARDTMHAVRETAQASAGRAIAKAQQMRSSAMEMAGAGTPKVDPPSSVTKTSAAGEAKPTQAPRAPPAQQQYNERE